MRILSYRSVNVKRCLDSGPGNMHISAVWPVRRSELPLPAVAVLATRREFRQDRRNRQNSYKVPSSDRPIWWDEVRDWANSRACASMTLGLRGPDHATLLAASCTTSLVCDAG